MRIAFLSNYSPENIDIWSGTPFYVYHSLKKRHDVVWLGGGIVDGARWHHVLLGRKHVFHPEFYCREMGRVLSEQINIGNFDIVISFVYFFCVGLNVNIPVIFFSDVTFNLFKDYFCNKDPNYQQLAQKTEQRCLDCVDAIVYSSEWARKNAIESYQIPTKKIHVIEFGANIPYPERKKETTSSLDVCKLLFVGRNWEKKGGKKVLDAYRFLKRTDFPCKLTIIGCYPPETIYDEDVTILPWLNKSNPEDMACYKNFLSQSHFLVIPTEFDAYGIVFCEASAYGIPSIAANVGGVSQPIKEGKNGYLLPPEATAEEYAQIIRKLFHNREQYLQLRKQSRLEFEKRLNWDVWCNRITVLMKKLIASERRKDEICFYLPVYAINLPERTDRLKHLKEQFYGKTEFEVTYVDAIRHPIGAVGLWESIKKSVRLAIERKEDVIIICEDDHTFTSSYSWSFLLSNILGAERQGAELLSGGISNFGIAVPVDNNRYWVDRFLCTQFIVLFKSLFQKILDYNFRDTDAADLILPALSKCNMVVYPFISVQQEFGYSDVTPIHNLQPDFVSSCFARADARLSMIHSKYHFFNKFLNTEDR